MSFKTNLILIILVLLGGVYIWLSETRMASTRERARRERMALQFSPQVVEKLEIESEDTEFTCRRGDRNWEIVSPIEARADAAVVERLLATLSNLEKRSLITRRQREQKGLSLADYGLAPPRFVIRMEGEDFKQLVNVGKTGTDDSVLYIASDNAHEDVLAVETNLLGAIPKDIADLRAKKLFVFDPDSVRKLDSKTSEGFISLVKDERDQWNLMQPYEAAASGRKIDKLIESLLQLKIAKFLRDDATEKSIYGFDEVGASIALQQQGESSTRQLNFGLPLAENTNLVYAGYSDEDSVFALPGTILDALGSLTPEDVRDKRILKMEPGEVNSIRIEHGRNSLEFTRSEKGWEMLRPRSWEASTSKLQRFLEQWTAPKIMEFVPLSGIDREELGLASNSYRIAFSETSSLNIKESEAERDWVEYDVGTGLTSNGQAVVTQPEGEWGFLVHSGLLGNMSVDPLAYKSRAVLDIDPQSIQRITLSKNDRQESLAKSESGEWQPDADESVSARALPINPRLKALSPLVCEAYAGNLDDNRERYGLKQPFCQLTLGLTGEKGISKTILFGSEIADGDRYASIRGQEMVFVLDRKLVEALCSDLYVKVTKQSDGES